jgi:tRNA 2-thiouridine synthesizing protein A
VSDFKVDKKLDIRGVVCPYTLVKSKLAVEDVEVGQVVEILLDYPVAVTSIPKSMVNYGNKVLNVEKISSTEWKILIKKEVDD